jgi:hypothetical protein
MYFLNMHILEVLHDNTQGIKRTDQDPSDGLQSFFVTSTPRKKRLPTGYLKLRNSMSILNQTA